MKHRILTWWTLWLDKRYGGTWKHEGYQKGIAKGLKDGHTNGYSAGYKDGLVEGLKSGHAQGYTKGKAENEEKVTRLMCFGHGKFKSKGRVHHG